jgi:hypothetical protein
MKNFTARRFAAASALAIGLGVALAVPASADHGGGGSEASGDCSMRSTWELEGSIHGDGDGRRHRIEVEFTIRSDNDHRGGWTWMISDNGTVVRQGTARADDEIGKRRMIRNLPGPDTIDLNASNTMTGETCSGQIVVHGRHRHS